MMLSKATFGLSITSIIVSSAYIVVSVLYVIGSVQLALSGTRRLTNGSSPYGPNRPYTISTPIGSVPSSNFLQRKDLHPIPIGILSPILLVFLAITLIATSMQFCTDITLAVLTRSKADAQQSTKLKITKILTWITAVDHILLLVSGLVVIILSGVDGFNGSVYIAFTVVFVILMLVSSVRLFTLSRDYRNIKNPSPSEIKNYDP